jgi:hypothetical protein
MSRETRRKAVTWMSSIGFGVSVIPQGYTAKSAPFGVFPDVLEDAPDEVRVEHGPEPGHVVERHPPALPGHDVEVAPEGPQPHHGLLDVQAVQAGQELGGHQTATLNAMAWWGS